MSTKLLNNIYMAVQSLVGLIALFFIWGLFHTFTFEPPLLVGTILIVCNFTFGMFFAIKNTKSPKNIYMRIITYTPFLLFFIGGIVLILGVMLMIIASYMRYMYKEVSS